MNSGIIKPLFGVDYCIKINDDMLHSFSREKIAKDRLFFNLDDILPETVQKKKLNSFISDILYGDVTYIEGHRSIIECKIYGQTLITSSSPSLPFIDNSFESYTVFNIDSSIEDMFIPSWVRGSLTQDNLIKAIRKDLWGFASILKSYRVLIDINDKTNIDVTKPFPSDDKNFIVKSYSNEEKIKFFGEAIVNRDRGFFEPLNSKDKSIYDAIINGFNSGKIKQFLLTPAFNLLYINDELHSRTLMAKLRKVHPDFFKTKSLKADSDNKKYWLY